MSQLRSSVLDGLGERRPVVGDVRGQRLLGDVEPRLQLPELLVDLVGGLANGREYRRLLPPDGVDVTPDPRVLRDLAGEGLQPSIRRRELA